jgi:hypothetical protein
MWDEELMPEALYYQLVIELTVSEAQIALLKMLMDGAKWNIRNSVYFT